MVKVKICGITRPEDAQSAVEAGADFLGLNFYPRSPRYVPPRAARELVASVPERVRWVGVFVNEGAARIKEMAGETGIHLVQLHGEESNDLCQELARDRTCPWPVIKALRISSPDEVRRIGDFSADYFLLDSFSPVYGGTGKTLDWEVLGREGLPRKKIFLAGGLSPGNVAGAIRTIRPFAVDVASGVEISPGRKDKEKLIEFIQRAKAVRFS